MAKKNAKKTAKDGDHGSRVSSQSAGMSVIPPRATARLQSGKVGPRWHLSFRAGKEGCRLNVAHDLMPASATTPSLGLVVSADCNLRCAYCYQDRKQPRQMSWATMARALDLLASSTRRRADVTFLGGEPLLGYPLIVRAVRRLGRRFPARRRPDCVIATNGLLLTPRRLAFLERHRFNYPAQLRRRCAIAGPAEPREFRDSRSPARPSQPSPPGVLPPEGDGGGHGDGACHPVTCRFVRVPPVEGRRRYRDRPGHGASAAVGGSDTRARSSGRAHLHAVATALPRRPAGCRCDSSASRRPRRGRRHGARWRASRRSGGTSRSTSTAKSTLARCSFARARPWRGLRSHAVWRP